MKKLLAVTLLLLFGVSALAVDSDGDGYDDSIDAFPNDECAITDTDGDGKPDTIINCFGEDFDGVHYGPALDLFCSSCYISNGVAGRAVVMEQNLLIQAIGTATSTVRLTKPQTLSFYSKDGAMTLTIAPGALTVLHGGLVTGVNYVMPYASVWTLHTRVLGAGTYTLQWKAIPNGGYLDSFSLGVPTTLVEDTDDDNDTVLDVSDNCPLNSNLDQLNTDGDAQGDVCDADDDNDGVLDINDAFPLDPSKSGDADGDGVDNLSDNCPSIPNASQTDTDADGNGDACDAFPNDAAESVDTDGDGVGNNSDNCLNVANASQTDTDGDGTGNACDSTPNGDTDGDGVDNLNDNCPAVSNASQTDTDENGFGDACEVNTSGTVKGDLLGSAVAVADMNNDGYDDLIVGSSLADVTVASVVLKDAGAIKIISGADGSVLNTFNGTAAKQQFGTAIAVVSDKNSDGIPDLLVGNPFRLNGNVSLYSGADGSLITSIADGAVKGDKFGAAVAVDENGNLIVGAPLFDVPAVKVLKDAGRVYVFSGISNNLLYTRDGSQQGEQFASALAVNTIDHQQLIGSPGFDVLLPVKLNDAGRVQIFDGTDNGVGAVLFSKSGSAKGDLFGSSLTSFSQDLDGDTHMDWAVGIPGADILNINTNKVMKDIGKLQLFSGFNPAFILEISGSATGDNFGAAACAIGDINNDGENDLVIGLPKFDPSALLKDAGQVEVMSGASLF